ncbi:replication restart helicase PriA [Limnoglobus roseus]|uniref:Replication restart protein PriA n=1 Tax=Limnoglobus roseus TaxID=2598579 RepID=A0A5C1A7J4_9BACT|nr:primosomal protein N' [Limnoglobus roseus]QEL14187.1 primosomal protein N' [Limnoglobus roseus]
MPTATNLFLDHPDSVAPVTLFVDVVFDRPLDHAYTYGVPDALRETVGVGKRVECPFGRGDKTTEGYVIRVADVPPVRAVKNITRVLDDTALLDEHLLKLTRWMADYYLCGWGQVLHAVVPAGVREKAGTKNVTFVHPTPREELPNPLPSVTPKQKQALDRLKREGKPMDLHTLARMLGGGTAAISSLVSKGLARKFVERMERSAVPYGLKEDAPPLTETPLPPITMNADQVAVWEMLRPLLDTGGYHPFLLHGVTGSGKTEIYLRAIEEVVRQGKEAIVLVPEISLTPQTIERFSGRCGTVAVLHSHLTDSERGQYWRRVATGQVQVVVGARSAVFAPTRKLGVIIIDEEHETSFKQESTPRYHARDVAVMRARLANVPIILGSATPSLESWHNAHRADGYTLLSLPNRVENRPLPKVQLVDLRHEPKTPGKHFAIGPTLEQAMNNALKANGQVMLFLNRRGFSTHVHCPSCGHVAQCAHCDLSLTFHRHKSSLVCHYCGWETAPFTKCPACSQVSIRYQGLGTEKLQEEIEAKFPNKVVQRMDSDTMSKPGSHQRVLDAFREGLIHILLGTQMIAKGLDFPNVTLVGVINADVGLHLPDFRAAERTFQLLAQVSGRAGRGEKGGQVMIQTFTPDHPCISLATKHDFISFSQQELGHRREHQYPPYQRLARLIVRSEKETAAAEFAETLAGAFKAAVTRVTKPGTPTLRLLGPAECPVFKLNGYYRFHFQIQSENAGVLHAVMREVLSVAKSPHGVEFQVDVDPYSML